MIKYINNFAFINPESRDFKHKHNKLRKFVSVNLIEKLFKLAKTRNIN